MCIRDRAEAVPEGYEWVWQSNTLYQKGTHFRLDESGWLINPRTKGYHDAHTGWRYDAANECLVDDETGKMYTMEREEIVFAAGVRCYPCLLYTSTMVVLPKNYKL